MTVADQILSYMQLCLRENAHLQRSMNFKLHGAHSVVLMSTRPGAPYHDLWQADGMVLIYEGHDEPKRAGSPDPKTLDQPEFLPSGRPSEKGKFHAAAQAAKLSQTAPERVQVYEKLRAGI
ncbi:hypothetical protein [Deinococcus alpinitundrae]|uniref:hypothetical protein n=1 Tax=Deinococcus alpinitundrae TaxID=468913 RepID=UPI00192A2DC7|nr:hypothetical protein [Deinococcus alpinitundrae]